jgi:hypothetical protein
MNSNNAKTTTNLPDNREAWQGPPGFGGFATRWSRTGSTAVSDLLRSVA